MEKREDLEEARSDLLNARAKLARHGMLELEIRTGRLVKAVETELTKVRDPKAQEEATSAP